MLLYIFNRCWAGEELPSNWLTSLIKPLLKDGKDPKETKSYRPIFLTSCLGKLLEIIADRLTFILEDRGLLADSQAGFWQNRCTVEPSAEDDAGRHRPNSQERNAESSTIVTFFDYEKAYDKAWRLGLIHKMQTMGNPR